MPICTALLVPIFLLSMPAVAAAADSTPSATVFKKKSLHDIIQSHHGCIIPAHVERASEKILRGIKLGTIDLDATNKFGDTVLHCIAAAPNINNRYITQLCRVLIHSGASLFVRNHRGQRPLDIARRSQEALLHDIKLQEGDPLHGSEREIRRLNNKIMALNFLFQVLPVLDLPSFHAQCAAPSESVQLCDQQDQVLN